MTDLTRLVISSYGGEGDGAISLVNLRDGKVHTDTVDVAVSDALGGKARIVTLTPQTAVVVAMDLLARAAASPRLEPHEVATLAEGLRHHADYLDEWNTGGERIWHGSN